MQEPTFLLQYHHLQVMTTSRDIKGRINDMRNNTISSTAQQIVLSTLNGVETEGRSVQQLIALFNSNKPTMNVALDDLEQANLVICCHGKGQNRREKQLVWLKSSRKLWTAALPFLQSPSPVSSTRPRPLSRASSPSPEKPYFTNASRNSHPKQNLLRAP